MQKIELYENKVLKLINVLSRKIPQKESFSQAKQMQILQNWVKNKGYETFGPIIFYSSSIKSLGKEDFPIIDTKVMVQLKQNVIALDSAYLFQEEVRIVNCLFVHFNDTVDNLQYAMNKLMLFAYENDIKLTGESYMVLLKQEGSSMLADIFMPAKIKTEEIL